MTEEALLMPVLLLVGQVLGVGANFAFALLARVGEELFVAADAVWLFILENVAAACQGFVTVVAAEMISVKVLIHCSCVLAVEY